jgi:hypothetical protein
VYLASAREHPPASAVRRQQRDGEALLHHLRDLNRPQTELFFLIGTFLRRYEPPELHRLLDADVAEAAAALAGTYETAARGVIYEHRPASLPADRLASALRPIVAEAGSRLGSSFDREAAVVLRRIEEAARGTPDGAGSPRSFLDLLERVLKEPGGSPADGGSGPGETGGGPRLIVK